MIITRLLTSKFDISFLLIEVLLVAFLSILNLGVRETEGHWATQNMLTGDGATFVLTATSHNKDLGVPYKDYWEYRPPGFFFLIDYWSKIFGSDVLSFKIMEAFFRILVGLQICFLARKIFSPFQAFVVSSLTLFVFFSPAFGIFLYPEPYGIFFSLMGLLSLIYMEKFGWRLFLSSMFFSIAMQTKDIFAGAELAFVPIFVYLAISRNYKMLIKGFFCVALGFVFPTVLLIIYLLNLGSLSAYIEVLNFKSNIYPTRLWDDVYHSLRQYYDFHLNNLAFVSYNYRYLLSILVFWIISILVIIAKSKAKYTIFKKKINIIIKIPSLTFSLNRKNMNILTLLAFLLGSFVLPSTVALISAHYIFATIISTYFLWGIAALFLAKLTAGVLKSSKINIFFLLFFLIAILPNKWIVIEYAVLPVNILKQATNNINIPEGNIDVEKYLASKTNSRDCILSVYGWKSTESYLYSERKPCTRFILPNIVITDWQKKEYRQSILDNPPKAVVYSIVGTDMNFEKFEKEVINLSKILNNCYKQDLTYTTSRHWPLVKLYFPAKESDDLKICLKNNAV